MIAMPEEATVQQLDLEPGAHLRLTHEPTGFTVTLLAEPQPQKRCGIFWLCQRGPIID